MSKAQVVEAGVGEATTRDRAHVVRRGRKLEYFTIIWNGTEGLIGVIAGLMARSVSLVAFGMDSFIEVASGSFLLWRMSVDADVKRREANEKRALRFVGMCFVLLAAYIVYESGTTLWLRRPAEHSKTGIVLAVVSLIVMPLLTRAKRRVGRELGSAAMIADAKQTEFCMWLSGILLLGLVLNAVAGLWWADPLAALLMVPIIVKEAVEGLKGETCKEC